MGNSLGRAVYEANVADNFRRPQTDSALESFIRAKYEQKKYIAKEWVPQPPQKLDWEKEMEEEEKQKKKKKAIATTGIPILPPPATVDKKPVLSNSSSKTAAIPPPLPKIGSLNSPKSNRGERKSNVTNGSSDLLGLNTSNENNSKNDSFVNFLDASSLSQANTSSDNNTKTPAKTDTFSSLDKEEADFFNQATIDTASQSTTKSNMTKENILALYAANPVTNFQTFNGVHPANFNTPGMQQLGGVFAQPTSYTQPFSVNNQYVPVASGVAPNPMLPSQQPFMPAVNMPIITTQWPTQIPQATGLPPPPPTQMFNYQQHSLPNMHQGTTPATTVDPLTKQFGSINLNNVWQ